MTATKTSIPDGTYYLHPAGCAWQCVVYQHGRIVAQSGEAEQSTHDAARDGLAGLAPSDTDSEVDAVLAAAIVADAMGPEHDATMVVVERATD